MIKTSKLALPFVTHGWIAVLISISFLASVAMLRSSEADHWAMMQTREIAERGVAGKSDPSADKAALERLFEVHKRSLFWGFPRFTEKPVFVYEDAANYLDIAVNGYRYEPNSAENLRSNSVHSTLGWMPLFTLLGRGIAAVLGVSAQMGLQIVALLSTLLAGAVFSGFLTRYYAARNVESHDRALFFTFLLMFAGPCSVFLYIGFSESLFLLLLALFLECARRRAWIAVAIVCALASGTRVVGVLLAPLLSFLYVRHAEGPWVRRLCVAAVLAGIAEAGFIAFMTYCHFKFGNAFALFESQQKWNIGVSVSSVLTGLNLSRTLSLVWGTLNSGLSPGYFYEHLMVVLVPVILLIGRKELDAALTVVGWSLWALPYFSGSHGGWILVDSHPWTSFGRYALVIFPVWMVLGAWCARSRAAAAAIVPAALLLFALLTHEVGVYRWVG